MLTLLFYHVVFLLLIIDVHFLILAVTAQNFNPISELVIPSVPRIPRIPSEDAKAEIEIHPVTVEAKIRKR